MQFCGVSENVEKSRRLHVHAGRSSEQRRRNRRALQLGEVTLKREVDNQTSRRSCFDQTGGSASEQRTTTTFTERTNILDGQERTDHEREYDLHHKCAPAPPLPAPPVQPTHELMPADYAALDAYKNALRSMMKDPYSFIIDRPFVAYNRPMPASGGQCANALTQKGKERCIEEYNANQLGTTDFCFEYHSKNSFGGYGGGTAITVDFKKRIGNTAAVTIVDFKKKLAIVESTDPQGCTAADWVPVPPAPAPAAVTPAEQAKAAQAYADCLKLAVDNPKIVCKQ